MSDIQDNIFRDGTSQKMRNNSGLKPENVLVDGRDLEYYLNYVSKLAAIIRYYDRSNILSGTWEDFFPSQSSVQQFISRLTLSDQLQPPLALFIAFTRLMEVLQADINKLSQQHLDFYFQKVLRFEREKAVADKVNVIFQPSASLTAPVVLSEGLQLLAGKDKNGNPIVFATDKEFTLSKASIARVSSVMVDVNEQSRVYAAPKADSADGISEPLPKDKPYWNLFGESQKTKSAEERSMIDGKVGFAIASSLLLLKEGSREVLITLECHNYLFTPAHLNILKTSGVDEAIIQQMQPVSGVFFRSLQEMKDAIKTAIGDTNFASNETKILDLIEHPFKQITDGELAKAFVVEATGDKDWFPINDVTVTKQLDSTLRVKFKLKNTDPAIVDYNALVHKQPINTSLPVVQISLDHESNNYLYEQLRGIRINSLNIAVEVKGVKDLVLHTENGPAKPAQPFLPFGAMPEEGSNFYFGSREVFSKKLDSLEMELSWANLPKGTMGFKTHYQGYPVVPNNEDFMADFSVLDNMQWEPLGPVPLFQTIAVPPPPYNAGDQPLQTGIYTVALPLPALDEEPLPEIKSFDPAFHRGFGKLTLKLPDFGHSVFPTLFAEKTVTKVTVPATVLPTPPYTPKLKHFALNYTASLAFAPGNIPTPTGDQVFHVEPLGLTPMNEDSSAMLLPQFSQGTLYIGLTDLQPPQNLSILFQLVDGSADPDIEVKRNDVKWSYFNKTKWISLSDVSIPMDTTFGLQTSGIVEFSIGNDASDQAPFWANGLYWLRAEFLKNPAGASHAAMLFTNAMVSTLTGEQATAGVLNEPLQPGSIAKLVNTDARVKVVSQPFSSFSGKGIEPENEFNQRVSERLRHKNRAVNLWDYEHILLQAFPSIYKVKCLPHTGRSSEPVPGSVTLLVIPDLRNRNKINPFQPKVSAVLRNQIADKMKALASGFAKVYVDNPVYEEILVEMSVGLLPGFDGNFYGKLLNEELKRFLSPWAYEEGKDIVFGGKIFKSSILSFIEQRPYVDYITNFRIYHLQRGPGIEDMRIREDLIETPLDFIVRPDGTGEEMDFEVVASSPRSILVTAENHKINVLNPGEFVCSGNNNESGIEAMIIEVDFFVF